MQKLTCRLGRQYVPLPANCLREKRKVHTLSVLSKALSVFIACSYMIIYATKQTPVKSNISKYCLTSIGRYRLIILPRGFVLVCLQKSILSSVRCNFHYNSFCFVFFICSVSPSPKKTGDFAVRRLRKHWTLGAYQNYLFFSFCSKFKTIIGKTRNPHTFDFLIFKLGLLGRSGPLNQVLMLNDAILTVARSNSFFQSRLVSMIHKRSLLLKGASWNILSSWGEEDI